MRRVLIVAYYFPPIGGIGSIRLAAFASHLPEFGWEPTVLTPGATPHPHDPSLRVPGASVVRSRSLEPSTIARVLPVSDGRRTEASLTERARGVAKTLIYPDAQVGWFPGAVVSGLKALRAQSFDAVFSSSFPITAHLVARTLSRKAGVPWVAEFRDPWSATLPADSPHRRRAAKLETQIARQASRLAMPTPTWAGHFGELWSSDIAVVRNGHELASVAAPRPDPPVLTHLGSFYPGRQSLASLWRALRNLQDRGEEFRVRFIGDLHPEVLAEAHEAGVGSLVEATGQRPHEEAIHLLSQSSMLFASGQAGDDPIARGWIPAKLYEYLATTLPILYLGDEQGDAGAMLAAQPGCFVVSPTDSEAVADAVITGLGQATYEREVNSLSRQAATRELARVFDAVALGAEPAVR